MSRTKNTIAISGEWKSLTQGCEVDSLCCFKRQKMAAAAIITM